MIAAIAQKHWMELRGRWLFATAIAVLLGTFLIFEDRHAIFPKHWPLSLCLFAFVLVIAFPSRFAATGVTTSIGTWPCHATDPSILFTLSLPLPRRTLLRYRAASGLFAMGTALVVALLVNAVVLKSLGFAITPWQVLTYGLWILVLLVPLYFLDTLLSIWFSEGTITQIQAVAIALLVPVLLWMGLLGPAMKIMAVFHHATLIPAALAACVIAAGLSAATVWALDRQEY
jgi:hypothetical protein